MVVWLTKKIPDGLRPVKVPGEAAADDSKDLSYKRAPTSAERSGEHRRRQRTHAAPGPLLLAGGWLCGGLGSKRGSNTLLLTICNKPKDEGSKRPKG